MDRRRFLTALLGYRLLVPSTYGQIVKPGPAGLPKFVDVTAQSRINFHCSASHTSQKYLIESMVGGVAMFDYNNDGRLDLFFVNGAALADSTPAPSMPDKSDPKSSIMAIRSELPTRPGGVKKCIL